MTWNIISNTPPQSLLLYLNIFSVQICPLNIILSSYPAVWASDDFFSSTDPLILKDEKISNSVKYKSNAAAPYLCTVRYLPVLAY